MNHSSTGPHQANVLAAAACLCKVQHSQWPRTAAKLRGLLRSRGCCAVRIPELVSPRALVLALLPALEGKPALRCLVARYAATAEPPERASEDAEASEASQRQAREAGARAAARLNALGASWFAEQANQAQIQWLCSQAYGVATVEPAMLVEELESRRLLSMASSGHLVYDVEQIRSTCKPILRKEWSHPSCGLWLAAPARDLQVLEATRHLVYDAEQIRSTCKPILREERSPTSCGLSLAVPSRDPTRFRAAASRGLAHRVKSLLTVLPIVRLARQLLAKLFLFGVLWLQRGRRRFCRQAALIEIDSVGGGQLLRSAFVYAALLGRPVRVSGIRGAKKAPGMRHAQVAAVRAVEQLTGSTSTGNRVDSIAVMVVPPLGGISAFASVVTDMLPVDAGTGGSVVLMMQSALPLMLVKSAARCSGEISMTFRGGTNVAPPPGLGRFQLNAPQVEYAELVLFPMLQRLFGVTLQLSLKQRGFIQGGGEVELRASAPHWPLPPFELLHRGEAVRVFGIAYSSSRNVLHMLRGPHGGREGGASLALGQRLSVTQEWVLREGRPASVGCGAGIVAVVETSSGCLLAGDSMSRPGVSHALVGEEAAHAVLAALDANGCVDQHLENQLVIFMALAQGTSRLLLGRFRKLDGHMCAALWLAERFGAAVRLIPDESQTSGGVLEIDGIGGALHVAR